jgi:hypothetical protein
MIYDLDPAANDTDYALAWQAEAVPEPAAWVLVLAGVIVGWVIRRRLILA